MNALKGNEHLPIEIKRMCECENCWGKLTLECIKHLVLVNTKGGHQTGPLFHARG